MDWQPIETAPRDGSEFQGWLVTDHSAGFWEPRCRFNSDTEAFEVWGRIDYDQDGWDTFPAAWLVAFMPQPGPPA